jgi:hypothetical protein
MIVDANYRYIAAAQEANARIAQRQQSLTLFVTMVLSHIAAMVALGNRSADHELGASWLVLGIPLASICLLFLNYKSEAALSNLRSFLSELERLGDAHRRLPSYNTHARWALSANKARRFHDFASAALVAGGHGIGISVALSSAGEGTSTTALCAITGIFGALATVGSLIVPRWRYQPDDTPSQDAS